MRHLLRVARSVSLVGGLAGAVALAGGPARSQASDAMPETPASIPAAASAASSPGPTDPQELGAFLDGLLAGLMETRHVPGAVVLVVRDGRVLFARGYGVADLETRRPIDPETTLFRVASVSKLFTATAAMQLVEQGKLDLDADVNRRLADFQVPEAYGTPITLRHLLTHTAGFDDAFLDMLRPLGTPPEPLAHALAELLPPRIRPPGEVIDYSNRGVALAGHLVERASGQSFDDYLREHVLAPLGMTQSGFHLPEPAPKELATGYDWRDGRFVPMGLDEMRMAPAGGLYTSAGQIARFLIAHLALGRIDAAPTTGATDASAAPEPARLLREETAREMQRTQFRNHPSLPGWCLGFVESDFGGVRVVGHGGDWRGYGTRVVLVPEANLGVFVSTTRSYDARFFDPLFDAFFARWFRPAPGAGAQPVKAQNAAAVPDRDDYLGTYIPVRRTRHELLKLGLLLSETRVVPGEHGALVLEPPEGLRDPARLLPLDEPDLFALEGDERKVYFDRDAEGRVTRVSVDAYAFDRVSDWDAPRAHAVVAIACLAVFVLSAIGIPIAALARSAGRRPPSGASGSARFIAWLLSLVAGGFIVALAVALTTVDPFALMGGVPRGLRALFVLPFVAIVLIVALALALWSSGRGARGRARPAGGGRGALARLQLALVLVAAVVFVAWCWTWNLLGIPS